MAKVNNIRCFLVLVLGGLLLASCEKTVESVSESPFDAFPNPCQSVLDVYFKDVIPATAEVSVKLKDSNNKPLVELDGISPTQVLAFDMRNYEGGIYYVELTIDGELFTESIIKVK
jgi:hypothetical protein